MTNAPVGPTQDRFLEEALVYVYIAQYVRPDGPERAGVLSMDCERYQSQLKLLVTRGDLRQPERSRHNAHLEGFVTTPQGTEAAARAVQERLNTNTAKLHAEFERVPQRLLSYLFEEMYSSDDPGPAAAVTLGQEVGRYDSLPTQAANPTYHCMLGEREVADIRDRLFRLFSTSGLMVIATNYSIVQGNPIRERRYVLAGETAAFWRDFLDSQGIGGRLWPLNLEEMHVVFHQLDADFGKLRQGREELQRYIPVVYREAVDSFLDECLKHKAITEGTLPNGNPCFDLVDKVWYENARAERFNTPLLDFLLDRTGGAPAPLLKRPERQPQDKADSETLAGERGAKEPELIPPVRQRESVLIGNAVGSGERVFWVPGQGADVRQPNRNVLIVGKPGTGKSQLIKAFVHELHRQGIPSIALDWVGEYTDVLPNKIDARQGITMNPLELSCGTTPYQTALEIASIVRTVFSGLGDIQEALLKDAILKAFEQRGIREVQPETWTLEPPTFDDVVKMLQQNVVAGDQRPASPGLLARISPFVDLKLFSGATTMPFKLLVAEGTSIILGGLFTDDLRIIFGHFFLNKLWYYVQNLGPTNTARFYLLLDEANRLAFAGSPLERLVREARKFGVGTIVASQRPGDFTETVPANAACTIALQCPLERDASFMAKQLGCRPADIQRLAPVFDAFLKFDYTEEAKRVTVLPYHQRVPE